MSKQKLIKLLAVISLIYIILQIIVIVLNDTDISRMFWLEHKNIKSMIDAGLPDKSRLTPVFRIISDHHFWLLRLSLVIIFFTALYYRKRENQHYKYLISIFLCVVFTLLICSGLITWGLKIITGKPRPYTGIPDYAPFSLSARFQSFPSGHTTETFSYIIPYMYFFRKKIIIFLLAVYGLLAVSTRVILAYHFFTDVLFGMYICAFFGCIICYYFEKKYNLLYPNKNNTAK